MSGPPPQPSRLRMLRGNPGKAKLNPAEPQPGPLSPECPEELTQRDAKNEWNRLVPHLIAIGMVTSADRAVLIGYCAMWAEWLHLHDVGPQDAAHRAYLHLLRSMAELGLTPASRSRVHAVPTATGKGQPWADVLP